MKKYRKKPVEVEAMQLGKESVSEILDWMRNNGGPALYTHRLPPDLRSGDWIARGVDGEFYPVPGEVFNTIYEEVQS